MQGNIKDEAVKNGFEIFQLTPKNNKSSYHGCRKLWNFEEIQAPRWCEANERFD